MTSLAHSIPEEHAASKVRAAILEAARTEFAAHGEHGASVRDIGRRAGVTAAMINYYFGGKKRLYRTLVDEGQQRLATRLATALAGRAEGELAAALAGAYFDFLAEEPETQRLLARLVLDQGEGFPTYAQRYIEPLRAAVASRTDVDDDTIEAAISLFGAIAGYFLYAPVVGGLLGEDPLSADRLARRRRHVIELAALVQRER